MQLVDTHFHFDLVDSPTVVAEEAAHAGVLTVGVTNLPSHFERLRPILSGHRGIRLGLGLHPLMAEYHEEELPRFLSLINETSYIGEIGLDFSRAGEKTREIQMKSMRAVLQHLGTRPRFFSIHSRGADGMVLVLLHEFDIRGAVFHWYSGSIGNLERAIRDGHYFSINTSMIQSEKGRSRIARMPRDRVLTETDGPYVRFRGEIARPVHTRYVVENLSHIWGISTEESAEQISRNFNKILEPIRKYRNAIIR